MQMAPAYGISRWLWQVAGLMIGCRFKRPGRGMLHVQHPSTRRLKPTAMHQTNNLP
jgi:hypothetical protein